MDGPPLVAWLLVLLSAATAVSCLLRDEARDEAVMGIGMGVMALPVSGIGHRPWIAAVFAVVYGGAALFAVLPSRRPHGHRVHHVVCAAAMVYMAVAAAGPGPVGGGGGMRMGAGVPVLTGLLLLYFAAYVLRTGVRLVTAPTGAGLLSGGGSVRLRSAPEVALACRVAMALGMLAMLLLI